MKNEVTGTEGTEQGCKPSAHITIRCLSAVPVDLEKLLADLKAEEETENA